MSQSDIFRLSTPTRTARRRSSPGLTYTKSDSKESLFVYVSPGWELNPRVTVLQTVALTTSPPGHFELD